MLDFDGMLTALSDHAVLDDYERRKSILRKYKNEIATMLITLRGAKVIGRNEIPADPATHCDLCARELGQDGIYVDGMINDGSSKWANMCATCSTTQGAGVGWGVGQLYAHNGAYWHCIGGGNPDACNEEME